MLMNDDQLDDLKQFITATVPQSEERLRDELMGEIHGLRKEVVDGFAGVGEAIEAIHQQSEDRDIEVDRRFTKLEQQTA